MLHVNMCQNGGGILEIAQETVTQCIYVKTDLHISHGLLMCSPDPRLVKEKLPYLESRGKDHVFLWSSECLSGQNHHQQVGKANYLRVFYCLISCIYCIYTWMSFYTLTTRRVSRLYLSSNYLAAYKLAPLAMVSFCHRSASPQQPWFSGQLNLEYPIVFGNLSCFYRHTKGTYHQQLWEIVWNALFPTIELVQI